MLNSYKKQIRVFLIGWFVLSVIIGIIYIIITVFYSPKPEYKFDYDKEAELLLKKQLDATYVIQDSLSNAYHTLEIKVDSMNKRNAMLKANIKKLQSEKDTILINIPVRTADQYERVFSDYFLRYHSAKDN